MRVRADSNKPPKAQPTIINQANDMIGATLVRNIEHKYTTDIARQTFEQG
ncbi:MAG TPA: hypothetical protein VN831_11440 [Bradyrhizobium sp.]|nr:hypothetical protein [Bradyrhizobium sp.]